MLQKFLDYEITEDIMNTMVSEMTLFPYEVKRENGSTIYKKINTKYFLENDTWYFLDVEDILEEKYSRIDRKKISFQEIKSPLLKLKIKFIFHQQIIKKIWGLNTAFNRQFRCLRFLISFFNEKYPGLNTFSNSDLEKVTNEWYKWLNSNGINTYREVYDKLYAINRRVYSQEAKFLQFIHGIYFELMDTRQVFEKDKWTIEEIIKMYSINYNKVTWNTHLDFNKIINTKFREEFKNYIKYRLISTERFSWSTALQYLEIISKFLNFICDNEPKWNNLTNLSREHILSYLEELNKHAHTIKAKNSNPEYHISQSLILIQKYLEDLQKYEYKIAPKKSIKTLIYSEDKPKLKKRSHESISHIPEYVLTQLFTNLNHLDTTIQSIVIVAFKTGLRISDVLGLTQDCLVSLNGKYQLVTDIEKTYVVGHTIPIDEDLASIVSRFIHKSINNSDEKNKPNKYIFINFEGKKKGKVITRQKIALELNLLARNYGIVDELENLWNFATHQFRHTFAVKMINSGADLLTVQELLAHSSPEMTLRYARLLDTTKRKAFEEALKQGVFSFDLNGKVQEVKPDKGCSY